MADALTIAAALVCNPRIERVGIGKLRHLTKKDLRDMKKTMLVEDWGGKIPIAVIIPYQKYLTLQEALFGMALSGLE